MAGDTSCALHCKSGLSNLKQFIRAGLALHALISSGLLNPALAALSFDSSPGAPTVKFVLMKTVDIFLRCLVHDSNLFFVLFLAADQNSVVRSRSKCLHHNTPLVALRFCGVQSPSPCTGPDPSTSRWNTRAERCSWMRASFVFPARDSLNVL